VIYDEIISVSIPPGATQFTVTVVAVE